MKRYHLPFVQSLQDVLVYAFLQRAPPPDSPSTISPGTHCSVDFPEAKHYQTTDAFLEDDNIDLVIICTGPSSHAEIALQAIAAGKHGKSYSSPRTYA